MSYENWNKANNAAVQMRFLFDNKKVKQHMSAMLGIRLSTKMPVQDLP